MVNMDCDVQTLISGNPNKVPAALKNFLVKSTNSFKFPELNENNYRKDLWHALTNILNNSHRPDLHLDALSAIRILSRDKVGLNEVINEELLHTIICHAGLENEGVDYAVNVEGLKCLSNIIFNSPVAAAISCKNGIIEAIIKMLRRDSKLLPEIKYFHMRILFLITALRREVRPRVKNELHGLTYLIETLDLIFKEPRDTLSLTDDQISLACEILKVLFNLTAYNDNDTSMDEEEEKAYYIKLVNILVEYLTAKVSDEEKKRELHNHITNLLTNIPDDCFVGLRTRILDGEVVPKELQFEEQNMKAVHEILNYFLDKVRDADTVSKQHEMLSPVLTVLLKGAKNDRLIRKYLRAQILPPLKDVHNRPEQGDSARNHMCRLLTSPIKPIHDFVSELLFIICKENVNRMIKYTGYGNAAGLFANRGLLGLKNCETLDYSDDSEDSDTEEYKQYKHAINPVMGCYEPPHPNPTANMTEEQKEYEAMKLVEMMDNLTRTGVVKPCRIGPDGRPQPISHVLQLQEGLQNQQVRMEDDSD